MIKTVFKRELLGYFSTPVAYIFLVFFLALTAWFTFQMGGLYERGQADLRPFFGFHPWLFLFLVPALSMRLWAEERRSGTIELLMTLPVTVGQTVVGKFLAAWIFTGIALLLTFPIWLTINYLGDPDNGAILAAYIGSFLMAGGFLAIGSCMSSLTKNQVVALILSLVMCFLFLISGHGAVLDFFYDWAPRAILDAIASFSFLTHFDAISKGVVDVRDLVFFGSVIALFLYANALILELKKAD